MHLFHAFPAHTQPKTVNFDNTGTRPRLAKGASVFPSRLRGLRIDDGPADQPLSSVCGPLLSAWDATLGYDGEGPPKSQSTPTEARVRKAKQRERESLRAGGMHKHVRFAPAGLGRRPACSHDYDYRLARLGRRAGRRRRPISVPPARRRPPPPAPRLLCSPILNTSKTSSNFQEHQGNY